MHADVSPLGKEKSELTDKEKAVADTLQRKLLVGAVPVNPAVPVYILYFTIYPNENGVLRSYSDVYGYDSLIYHQLENYI
jgi:murein L,D-transpeptidase YcbB/YkuD